MASVVGHALGALSVWEMGRRLPGEWRPCSPRWYVLPCFIAIIPDLDVFWHTVAHRGASHSLLVALFLAVFATAIIVIAHGSTMFFKALLITFLCAAAHPLLDYLMGCGPRVMFFWPLTQEGWLSPIQLVPTAYYARSISGLLSVACYPETWKGVGLELISLGGLWLCIGSKRASMRRTYGLVSFFGFLLVFLLYNRGLIMTPH